MSKRSRRKETSTPLPRSGASPIVTLDATTTVTVAIRALEDIEDRLFFLSEVLSRDPCLEDHHIKGLATMLGDIGTEVFRLHTDDPAWRGAPASSLEAQS